MTNTKERPEWLDNAVFYEIYPQSFNDTNADGIGDLNGITEKLDYIKELGCTAIWINPCFKSPFGDAGYDVEDYYTIAPRYGTNEDMVRLFSEAHRRGMHVILDLVPGHTAVTHEWFRESMKAERNEYTDRYVWTNSIWEEPQGMGCIRGISDRDGSCAVNFFSHQPALNYGFYKPDRDWQQPMDAPGPMATREALKDIMRFWLSAGCDGFRVDMAGSLVKHDEDGKGTIALWQDIREFLDREFPHAAMVSEWGEPDKSLIGGFHMDFLLHFGPSHYNNLFRCAEPYFSKRGNGSAKEFIEAYKANYAKTNGRGLICIPSGNHDMDRLARSLDPEELRVAFAFLLSMPGAPFIYYGDEIGMRYVEGLTSVEGGFGRTGLPFAHAVGFRAECRILLRAPGYAVYPPGSLPRPPGRREPVRGRELPAQRGEAPYRSKNGESGAPEQRKDRVHFRRISAGIQAHCRGAVHRRYHQSLRAGSRGSWYLRQAGIFYRQRRSEGELHSYRRLFRRICGTVTGQ